MNHLHTSTDDDVRRKFFCALGIDSKSSPISPGERNESFTATIPLDCPPDLTKDSHEWVNPRSLDIVISHVPLKCHCQSEPIYQAPEKRRKKNKHSETKQKKRCYFNEVVNVVPIPMRSEYSNRVRTRLWSNAMEIHENAQRNTVEFAAEGWDWRRVTLDESMFVSAATGELVHPIHYEPSRCYPEPQL